MTTHRQRGLKPGQWPALALMAMALTARADVLVGTNGERFVGKVVEETADSVVFASDLGGRLTIPRKQVLELQRTPPADAKPLSVPMAPSAASLAVSNVLWQPPGLGSDGYDWVQLISGEWLKGWLNYVRDKNVNFDSDKLEVLSLKLKDVRQIYTGKPMFTKFDGREPAYGTIVVSNEVVQVAGPEQLSLPRDELTGITPGGKREISFWSGKLSVGLNMQAGNTKQTSFNSSAELARRTPTSQFLFNYLGNFGQVNGAENANNQRLNANYDLRVNRDWFVRPVQLEYYRDRLANVAHRGTAGVGAGYYIFDRDTLEWLVAAGPAFQYTRFSTVEAGQADTASTPAGVLQSYFKADITERLKFIQSLSATLMSKESGRYSHHAVSTLEFEIKRHLSLDVSFVWDYLQNPQPRSDRVVPQHGDFYLNLGVGVRF
jgi:putative salt-induced outer membrane protein YdiY